MRRRTLPRRTCRPIIAVAVHGNASARARGDLRACTGLGVGPVVLIP